MYIHNKQARKKLLPITDNYISVTLDDMHDRYAQIKTNDLDRNVEIILNLCDNTKYFKFH